ncbi:MAG: hypothetical protein DI570_00815 [Phenylobacterium zucineum]|nr:MAG: hypothetical protein DI570_00815 [Phenylobacterium zucineum]
MREIVAPNLHDFTLVRVVVDWEAKAALFELLGPDGLRTLTATGLLQFELTRDDPWGPSASVNGVEVAKEGEELLRVTIEMQTGDLIKLRCANVN